MMNTQATVLLPATIYQQASQYAKLSGQKVSDLVADVLLLSLPTSEQLTHFLPSVSTLPDEQVLVLTNIELDQADDAQLSFLLSKQQAGMLQGTEQLELSRLMQLYQIGLLRKAEAMAEAVQRGLRAPLSA